MNSSWIELEKELDKWGRGKHKACFWWRDDDLEAPGPKFQRLLNLRRSTPISLAVIPKTIQNHVAKSICGCDKIDIIQHGFLHKNHEIASLKKNEFGPERLYLQVKEELSIGKKILEGVFGDRFFAVFVPPWNRMADIHSHCLRDLGFLALSGFGTKSLGHLQNINTHIDPISWKTNETFLGTEIMISKLILMLKQERRKAGFITPIGLLTHHKQMNEDVWKFFDQLLKTLQTHPHVTFKSIREIINETKY